jgi:hypothetical protein
MDLSLDDLISVSKTTRKAAEKKTAKRTGVSMFLPTFRHAAYVSCLGQGSRQEREPKYKAEEGAPRNQTYIC